MEYYAHSKVGQSKSEWQRLKDHLEGTAKLAAEFAAGFGAKELGFIAGLMHDIGKYSEDFQKRLEGKKLRVDHSTAGALEAEKHYKTFGRLLSYVIAGHHCGLQDWGSRADDSSLEGRLSKGTPPDYSPYLSEISLPKQAEIGITPRPAPVARGFSTQFLIRFLYSALVDADFLDTERALDLDRSLLRGYTVSLGDMLVALETFLGEKLRNATPTLVNKRRADVLADCERMAAAQPGLFTLTVPTGGGKTLSSMLFALKHALTYGMDKVIYVIPYTSIIEQNAAVFKEIFGEELVLEHHSNFSYPHEDRTEEDSEYEPEIAIKLKLASENWDRPIIATTNVQFFESLFAARSSRCRKLHNVANSVVIVDEAQMIPTGFLKPCVNALVELTANYHTTVVLCTATQPAINRFLPLSIKPREIVSAPQQLYEDFRRVEVRHLGQLSDNDLAERLLAHKQVLCIVNSKKHAREIYELIEDEDSFHLSTRMCPVHRSEMLTEIRARLQGRELCRVVSTQLIEAGVDVDFPVVFRSAAGIDSIAQAAGRCNREGLRETGSVYVFKPEKHGIPAGWLSRTATVGEGVLARHNDPLSLSAVQDYFVDLYNLEGAELDREGIMAAISEQERQLHFSFRTIAETFKLIDDQNMTPIVVPWNAECCNILEEVKYSKFPGQFARKLQRYSVQVFDQELKEMIQLGFLENIGGWFYVLSREAFGVNYSPKLGLLPCTDSMLLRDTLII